MSTVLLLALALASPGPAGAERFEWRLLRSIQMGALQRIDPAEALRLAKDSRTDFLGHVLARCALTLAGRDEGFPEWPLERLLDRTLGLLVRGSGAFQTPEGMPEGFGGAELVHTIVYALVTAGRTEKAVDVLESHLASGGRYKKAVVLQALRNIGDPRSTALIQRFVEAGDDANLGENLLADLHYPFLEDLRQRLHLIPPERRGREDLLAFARERCGERPALAVYFLGFLPESENTDQNEAELALLRELTREGCFWTRYFAVRALALRSAESIAFWVEAFKREEDAWQRGQITRIGFARFGRAFAAPALALLRDDPAQYVQWELMHGNVEVREGARFRSYWDIWQPPTLQFHLNFPRGGGPMAPSDVEELLAWLESGARPRNEWVRNHLLHGLARHVAGRPLRRYLRAFDALPDKARHFWILDGLGDPQALPLLRYWRTLPAEAQQRDALEALIARLEDRRRAPAGAAGCCRPTRDCLLSWVHASAGEGQIVSAEQARAWLEAGSPSARDPEVRFLDALGRIALVRWPEAEREERWEHLYGCWRRVGPGRKPASIR